MEQLMFAEALFADLISLHPMLCSLPPVVHKKESYYDSTIGKAIMIVWFNVRKIINLKLRNDSSKFNETQVSFKKYLIVIADFALSSADKLHEKIFVLSASLMEVISFLYRRGMTDYIYHAPHYWLHMFHLIDSADFYEQGGWHALKLAAKKLAEDYDKMKDLLQMQYWSENSGETSRPTSVNISKKLQAQDSTETSSGEFAEESPSNERSEEIPQGMNVTERKLSDECETSERKGNLIPVQSPKILHYVASENLMLQTESESATNELRLEKHQLEKSQKRIEIRSFPGEIVAHHEQLSENKDLISGFSKDTVQVVHEKSSPAERKCINEENINEVQSDRKQSSSENDVTKKQSSAENCSINEQSSKRKEIVVEVSEKSSEEKKSDHPEQKLPGIDLPLEVTKAQNKEKPEASQHSTAERKDSSQKAIKESEELSCSYEYLSVEGKDFCDNALGKSKEKEPENYENPNNEKKISGNEIMQYTKEETGFHKQSPIGRYTDKIKRSHDMKIESEEALTLQISHFKETVSELETEVTEEKAADDTNIKSAQTVFGVSEQHKLSTKKNENFEMNKNEFKFSVEIREPIEQDELSISEFPESQTSKSKSLEVRSGKEHGIHNVTVRSKTHKTPYKEGETSTQSRSQDKIAGNAQKLSNVNSSNKKVTPKSKPVTPKLTISKALPALHKTPTDRGDSKFQSESCGKEKRKSEGSSSVIRRTPSDREHFSKCQSKSTGKDEKNRRLSLPKGSPDTSKPSRRTNSAKAKSESKTNKNLQCPGPSGSKQSNEEKSDSKTDKNSKILQCIASRMQSSSKTSNVQGKTTSSVGTTSGASYAKGSRKLETHHEKSVQSSSESVESVKATGVQNNPRKIQAKDPKSEKPRWR